MSKGPCNCGVCQECDWARSNEPIESQKSLLSWYDEFVDASWRFKPLPDCGHLSYATMKLNGEAGEVAEKVGKAYRDSSGDVSRLAVLKELGDVLFYITKIAHLFNSSLEEVAKINEEKINSRIERGTLQGEGDDR